MSTIAAPETPQQFEEALSDKAQIDGMLAAGTFGKFVKGYVNAVQERDDSIQVQVKEQVQSFMADWARENEGHSIKGLNLDHNSAPSNKYHKLANPNAIGAPLNGVFPDMATYLQAVWQESHPSGHVTGDNVERMRTMRAYQEKVPSEGGFLVPEEFRAELLRVSLESSIVRPRARVVPMSSATLRFPMIDSTSNVSSVYGGVVVYRTEEGAELTESAATFGSIKLEATKQTALAHVTNELVRDWGAFGVFIDEIFPEAMAYYEDIDYISGNGAGAPLGALNANNTALISVAKASGQAATTIVWENVIAMYSRMLPSSLNNAVWLASPDTFAELATMALSVGTGGSAVWLTDGHGAPVLTLLGRPIIMTEKAPAALGTVGDLSFVDWSMYLIGDRQQMTVDSSPHVKFTSDKTTYRVIQRNDGRPWLQSPITPHNNSATLSPFVNLATRA